MRYNLVLTDIYMQILQNTKQNKNVFMLDLDETLTFTWIIRDNNKKSKIQTNTMLDRKLQKEHFKQGVLEKLQTIAQNKETNKIMIISKFYATRKTK